MSETFTITAVYAKKRWVFPKEEFVEYEPKDELWCRPLGIGREVSEATTVCAPRMVINEIGRDGTIRFVQVPEHPVLDLTS